MWPSLDAFLGNLPLRTTTQLNYLPSPRLPSTLCRFSMIICWVINVCPLRDCEILEERGHD